MPQNASSKHNTQYAPQTGPYKVMVKDKGIWQRHHSARLQISVGNPKHEGEKFFALAEWAAARFDHITVIVSDTLQRHNLALRQGLSPDEALRQSYALGTRWLEANKLALALMPQARITRWNDWLDHSEHNTYLELITSLYQDKTKTRESINEKAREFTTKHAINDGSVNNIDLWHDTSVHYILEELAAFALMFSETKAVDVYPGSWFSDVFEALALDARARNLDALRIFGSPECVRVDFVKNHYTPVLAVTNPWLDKKAA